MKKLQPLTLLSLLLGAFAFSACPPEPVPATDTEPTPLCKTLLIIGDDRSGSTKETRKLNEDDYRKLLNWVADNGGGTMAVAIIGNPNPTDRQLYRAEFEELTPLKKIPQDLTLTEKGVLKKQNDETAQRNANIKAGYANSITDFLQTVNDKVIGYKPNGGDLSDVDNALAHIETVLNEPQFEQYDRIFVVLLSDGINQPTGKIVKLTHHLDTKRSINLCTLGWLDLSVFESISNKNQFDSKDGLFKYLNGLHCN